jgi:hypothetical protein
VVSVFWDTGCKTSPRFHVSGFQKRTGEGLSAVTGGGIGLGKQGGHEDRESRVDLTFVLVVCANVKPVEGSLLFKGQGAGTPVDPDRPEFVHLFKMRGGVTVVFKSLSGSLPWPA